MYNSLAFTQTHLNLKLSMDFIYCGLAEFIEIVTEVSIINYYY